MKTYTEYAMDIVIFDERDVWTWLVDDGSDMEVEAVVPQYTDR